MEYRAVKHNTDADALSRVSWEATHKSAKHRHDADTDDDEQFTHVAETLASIADTTRLPERVQLRLLEDAIHVEELGVTTPADECAEQATCLPSIPRDQISMLQQKDAANSKAEALPGLREKAQPTREEARDARSLTTGWVPGQHCREGWLAFLNCAQQR